MGYVMLKLSDRELSYTGSGYFPICSYIFSHVPIVSYIFPVEKPIFYVGWAIQFFLQPNIHGHHHPPPCISSFSDWMWKTPWGNPIGK